LILAFKALVNV